MGHWITLSDSLALDQRNDVAVEPFQRDERACAEHQHIIGLPRTDVDQSCGRRALYRERPPRASVGDGSLTQSLHP